MPQNLKRITSSILSWIHTHPRISAFLLAGVLYAACSAYYQGTAFNCTDLLMSGPGDQTAGLIWLNHTSPASPFWGFTHVTNFPYGEQLQQPVQASGALGYVLYWMLAKLVGSVCGFNLLNLVGFLSSALVMFAFVRWLTGRASVALLAGYAVTFTPYLQIKTSVHPSYVFQGLLVGLLWMFLYFWNDPTWKKAVGLGVIAAASFYLDPYFVLLTMVLLVACSIGAGLYNTIFQKAKGLRHRIGLLLLAVAAIFVLILPLVYIRLHYATQINSFVGNSRNDIKFDASLYAAHPLEYFKPAATNQIALWLRGPGYAQNRNHHLSNPAEYTINLSLTLIAIVLTAAAILAVDMVRRRRPPWPASINLKVEPWLLLASLTALGLLAFALSLPPVWAGHKMLSYYLTNYVDMWRVFARLYILVNIALVVLAAIALAYLSARFKVGKKTFAAIIITTFAIVAVEYQIFPVPRPVWSYRDNVPQIYYRLHDRTDITSVAEYSLDEQPVTAWPTFYFTYQYVHGKQMLNSYLPNSPQARIRESIRDLRDPQTLPTLRSLGVQAIIVHGQSEVLDIPGLKLVDYQASENPPRLASESQHDPAEIYPIGIYTIDPGTKGSYVVAPNTDFIFPIKNSFIDYDYVGKNGATLRLFPDLADAKLNGLQRICADIRAEGFKAENIALVQSGQTIWQGNVNHAWIHIDVAADSQDPITVITEDKSGPSFVLNKLGCS